MSARILLVDDVPANTRLLSAKLASDYYQVEAVADGLCAIDAARRWLPDLILLDVMMPGMDGFETCRRIKSDERLAHIPIVMVTALSDPLERVRGLEAGADDFMTKPVDYETLIARMRGLVRLKRLLDEGRLRERTLRELGLAEGLTSPPCIAGRRVLVVDDWQPWAQRVAAALMQEGVHAELASGEAEALTMLETLDVDLVVLSLSIAAEDPLRLASQIRANPATSDVPLLLVAEPEHQERLLRGFELGASDWLARPIDVNELRVRARNQIRRKIYQERLRAGVTDALQLALVDQMTGLHNRRYLMQHLAGLMANAAPAGIAMLMIDVDHFKVVNDRWGHGAGDRTLRLIADVLRQHVRAFDSLARYGGEEFVIVMPGASDDEAWNVAERLRCAVEVAPFRPDGATPHILTVSVGLARSGDAAATPDQLLHAADQALYAAKRAGRNRTLAARELT